MKTGAVKGRRHRVKRLLGCGLVVVVLAVAAVAVLVWSAVEYHSIVREQIEVEASWSRIENAYQHRIDLATYLAETIRTVPSGGTGVVEDLTRVRSQAAGLVLSAEILNEPGRFREFQRRQDAQTESIARALEALEASTDLLRLRNVVELHRQLAAADRRLAEEADGFNDVATRFNAGIEAFPRSIVARALDFRAMLLFERKAAADGDPDMRPDGADPIMRPPTGE